MTQPPERDAESPAETLAENEPRSRRGHLLTIVIVVLAVGTVLLTQEVRKRRNSHPPARGTTPVRVDDPSSLGLPPFEVAVELQSVAHRIRAAWKRDGEPPTSLRQLPPDDDDPPANPESPSRRDPPFDLWGRPYLLERSETARGVVLVLITHGSDGVPGGSGSAQDLSIEIEAPEVEE